MVDHLRHSNSRFVESWSLWNRCVRRGGPPAARVSCKRAPDIVTDCRQAEDPLLRTLTFLKLRITPSSPGLACARYPSARLTNTPVLPHKRARLAVRHISVTPCRRHHATRVMFLCKCLFFFFSPENFWLALWGSRPLRQAKLWAQPRVLWCDWWQTSKIKRRKCEGRRGGERGN